MTTSLASYTWRDLPPDMLPVVLKVLQGKGPMPDVCGTVAEANLPGINFAAGRRSIAADLEEYMLAAERTARAAKEGE